MSTTHGDVLYKEAMRGGPARTTPLRLLLDHTYMAIVVAVLCIRMPEAHSEGVVTCQGHAGSCIPLHAQPPGLDILHRHSCMKAMRCLSHPEPWTVSTLCSAAVVQELMQAAQAACSTACCLQFPQSYAVKTVACLQSSISASILHDIQWYRLHRGRSI